MAFSGRDAAPRFGVDTMAFPWEWPADVWLQALICAGFIVLTLVLVRIDLLRTVVLATIRAILNGSRFVAGGVIRLFDKTMPLDGRSGQLPRLNFAAWIGLNAAIVAAWIVAGEVPAAAQYAFPAAMTAATFAVLNLLLLGASYWAVRETVEVTNGELPPAQARFVETSPARNVVFVLGTAAVLVLQIAVVMDWVQHAEAVTLVDTDGTIGPHYLNFLLATVDALPLAAFYVAPLAHHAGFSGGLFGLALDRGLNGLGSILIVSTAIGLFQQRLAFQRMIDGLVNTPGDFPEALLARFKNAPSAIKGAVMNGFKTEQNDNRRLRLARLAMAHRSYTFPAAFAAMYANFSDNMREEGSSIVASFLADPGATFDPATLLGFFSACDYTQRHGGFRPIEDKRRIARLFVPALERLAELDPAAADSRIRATMAQRILKAAVQGKDDDELSRHAARLLTRTASYEAVAPLLRALPTFDEPTALAVLAHIIRILGDKKIQFPPGQNVFILGRIAAAGKAKRRKKLSPAVAAQFERAMDKLNARRTAAAAEIEKEKKKREKAAAVRRRSRRRPNQQRPMITTTTVANPVSPQ